MQRGNLLAFALSLILLNVRHAKGLVGFEVRPVEDNEFSSVVCLSIFPPGQVENHRMHCSGTVMSMSHVLTTAYCLDTLGPYALDLIYGNGDLMNGTFTYPLWWISFDSWVDATFRRCNSIYNDLAIIKIPTLMANIHPAFISGMSAHSVDGMQIMIFGCGKTHEGTIPTRVHVGLVQVMKLADCVEYVMELEREPVLLPYHFMCTKFNPYVHLDWADRGGPVLFFGTVVAINVALGPYMNGTWDINKVNLHIYVEFYRPFINEILNL